MLRDEAVAFIQEELGFRSDKADRIIARLKEAQKNFEEGVELPWFLKTEVSSILTVSGEERVPLPGDFIREYENDALYYFNAAATDPEDQWVPLAKDNLQFLRTVLPGSGPPQAYALDKLYFRIFPTPDAAYTLKMIYYRQDAMLDSNIENEWLKHAPWMVIGWAGARMAAPFRDKEAKAEFEKTEARERRRLFINTEAREHENRRYIMGDPD